MALAVGGDRQDTPLLHRAAFLRQRGGETLDEAPLGVTEQVREIL
ncbi:hypothetical protein ACFYRY_11300 [Streptomyces sp. NPDC005263]